MSNDQSKKGIERDIGWSCEEDGALCGKCGNILIVPRCWLHLCEKICGRDFPRAVLLVADLFAFLRPLLGLIGLRASVLLDVSGDVGGGDSSVISGHIPVIDPSLGHSLTTLKFTTLRKERYV